MLNGKFISGQWNISFKRLFWCIFAAWPFITSWCSCECTLSQQEAARVLKCVLHSCETLSIVDGSKVRNLSIVPWSVLAPLLKCTCSPFYLVYARQSTVMVSPSPNSCVTTPLEPHAMVLVPLVKSSSPPPPSLWLSWPPSPPLFARKELLLPKSRCPQHLRWHIPPSVSHTNMHNCLLTALHTHIHAQGHIFLLSKLILLCFNFYFFPSHTHTIWSMSLLYLAAQFKCRGSAYVKWALPFPDNSW